MTSPIILVPGTWGRRPGHGEWWHAGSPFADVLRAAGCTVLGMGPIDRPFDWSTNLDGVDRDHVDWETAGEALCDYAHRMAPPSPFTGQPQPVSVIAHSHGGAVLAYAARYGLVLDRAVTVATPVRAEMEMEYAMLHEAALRWTHVYTDERRGGWWQWLGAVGLGQLFAPRARQMRRAHANVFYPNGTHSGLVDAGLWAAQGWAGLVTDGPIVASAGLA